MLWTAKPCNCTQEVFEGQKRDRRCELHGNLFVSEKAASTDRRPRSTLKRTQRRETTAEKRARLHFNEVVKSWPCWFRKRRPCEACDGTGWAGPSSCVRSYCLTCQGSGTHRCGGGTKDAHHLIPKQFIRQRCSQWAEHDLLAVLFNPLIGAPLCRDAHNAITAGTDRIYWEDLSEECLEYVGSLPDFVLLRLELECPKRPLETAKEAVTTGCQEESSQK